MTPESIYDILNAGRIVAICKGNTCRSPFIAACLSQAATKAGLTLPLILSRGLSRHEGERSSAIAIDSARKFSVELSSHSSQSIYAETPKSNDVYLLVDPQHEAEVKSWSGNMGKIIFPGLFDPHQPDPTITDPYHGDSEIYEQTYARIQRACDGLVQACLTADSK